MDFNGSLEFIDYSYSCVNDLHTANTVDSMTSITMSHHDDFTLPADNRVSAQPDVDRFEYTEIIWQNHQRSQFQQQIKIWNSMSYSIWVLQQQQQHLISQYRHDWSVENMSLQVSYTATENNVYPICPFPLVQCPEHKGYFVPAHTLVPSHINTTSQKSFTMPTNTKKAKRARITYTYDQVCILERSFQNSRFSNKITRARLAKELGVTVKQVKLWFQNRRSKKIREEDV